MTRNKFVAALLLSSAMAAAPAMARDGAAYVGVEGGFFDASDIEFDLADVDTTSDDPLRVKHSNGYDVGAVVGYDFGMFRVELEGSRKVAELNIVELNDSPVGFQGGGVTGRDPLAPGNYSDGTFTSAGGSTRIWAGMLNALLDIGGNDGVGVSIGGGVGYAQIDADIYQIYEPGVAFIDDKTEEFAYQGIAELYYPIARWVDVGVKYRYFRIPDYTQVARNGTELDGKFQSHSALATLSFNFGGEEAAPPPPPPPPPAPVADNFLVFFDWDESDVTSEAADTLNRAATAYSEGGSASVTLAGHADKSGSASYNVGLSQRRADAVREYLVGRGVPEGVISTEAFGESRPLVETADGVREPQNRRVEINFGGAGM